MLGLHNKMLIVRLSKQAEMKMMLGTTASPSLLGLFKILLSIFSSAIFPLQAS